MNKEETEEHIIRCKELQSNCRIDDIDTFLKLSERIEALVMLLERLEKKKYESQPKEENRAEFF